LKIFGLKISGFVFALTIFLSISANRTLADGFVEYFGDEEYRNRWSVSNFDQGGDNFLTAWRRHMASVVLPSTKRRGGGALILELAPNPNEEGKPFHGAEVQRGGDLHYGRYEVFMKAGRGDGVVSALFTYTGPYFGDPHDEIDFEFLGRDTRKVWINAFGAGQRMPGKWIELGFDAAAAPHLYTFDWRSDSITWYVDGHEIHSITSETHAIPSTPSKLFLDIWVGNPNQVDWVGTVQEGTTSKVEYYCVSYRAFVDQGLNCSDYIATQQ
jgi:beta-glucanase (GH16 family)